MNYKIYPLGDQAVIIEFGQTIDEDTHERVKSATNYFEDNPIEWMTEYIPAFTTVAVFYDPLKVIEYLGETDSRLPYEMVVEELDRKLATLKEGVSEQARVIEIPVCYGGELGPDLSCVAEHNGLTEKQVIEHHTKGDYLVYMIGFAPGFPYIGGMTEKIATPRKEEPRLKIPAGSVGIAGGQTGVYPIETPGGWQLIGRTPLPLFRPEQTNPSLLQAGDKVVFKAITRQEYDDYKEGEV
ncbi:5-oxoprolinase subunit PxpB [Thalassobacillus devorans]|uniref:5-oxoprolinase subunit PxpB n=1 Tax=Thalassobacillus devorans TaxID=279813 RepID=UPI00048BEEE6|nr:5-oxoprolinase subunit PxpB [Thalassobacillus devorans]